MSLHQHIQSQQDAATDLEVVLAVIELFQDSGEHRGLQGGLINVARRMARQINDGLDVTALPEAQINREV